MSADFPDSRHSGAPHSGGSGESGARPAPRPTPEVARRVEELLREQLFELGVNPADLSPRDIAEGMLCRIAPDNSLTYEWHGRPLLHVTPEVRHGPQGESVLWRMFTRDDTEAAPPGSSASTPSRGSPARAGKAAKAGRAGRASAHKE